MKQFTEKDKERIKKTLASGLVPSHRSNFLAFNGYDVSVKICGKEYLLASEPDIGILLKKLIAINEDRNRLPAETLSLLYGVEQPYYSHETYGCFPLSFEQRTPQEIRIGAMLNTDFRISLAKTFNPHGEDYSDYMGMFYERITGQWLAPCFHEQTHKGLYNAVSYAMRCGKIDAMIETFGINMPELRCNGSDNKLAA